MVFVTCRIVPYVQVGRGVCTYICLRCRTLLEIEIKYVNLSDIYKHSLNLENVNVLH